MSTTITNGTQEGVGGLGPSGKSKTDRSFFYKGNGDAEPNNNNNDKGPTGPKGDSKKSRSRIDPSRALEPVKKKLTSIEAQRIMNVFSDTIDRIKLVSMIPYITEHLEEFETIFEPDLLYLFKQHILLQAYYVGIQQELVKRQTERESINYSQERTVSLADDQPSEQPENASVSYDEAQETPSAAEANNENNEENNTTNLKPDENNQPEETSVPQTQVRYPPPPTPYPQHDPYEERAGSISQGDSSQDGTAQGGTAQGGTAQDGTTQGRLSQGRLSQGGRADERQRGGSIKVSQTNNDIEQEPEAGEENGEKKDDEEKGEEGEEEIDEEEYSATTELIVKNLNHIAEQIGHSCKNILRAFSKYPSAVTAVNDRLGNLSKAAAKFIQYMEEMKVILRCRLLTSPIEEKDQADYLKEMNQKTIQNEIQIRKLEAELAEAISIKEEETRKRNDIIRRLQEEIRAIDKHSEENIRRVNMEADKNISLEMKTSDAKCAKIQQEMLLSKTSLQNLTNEHRNQEMELRRRNYKAETEVENWIQKYDQDMGQLQDEFETIDTIYNEEKKQLEDLEARFDALQKEYVTIIDERELARKLREESERKMVVMARAATTIQAFWRSYKVRKILRAKKKKLAAMSEKKKKKKKK